MIVRGPFMGVSESILWRELYLVFVRTYWEAAPEDYEESAAMALGYQGA